MKILFYYRIILPFIFLLFQPVMASDHQIPSRLIIGFHEDAYISLGGASEATDYINSQWGDKKPVSLVRPINNAAILVEVQNPDAENLNKIINKLMQMDKIRYVDEDKPVEHFPAQGISIPTLK